MLFKSKWFQLSIAVAIGIIVMLLPRPEGTRFKVSGENIQALGPLLGQTFQIEPGTGEHELILTARNPDEPDGTAAFIESKIAAADLIGGGRCMVSAAFLKEFTGIEISFFDWIKYAMPAALLCIPLAVGVVYLIYRPDPKIKLPPLEKSLGPWSVLEKKTLAIAAVTFVLWLTKGFHGIDYSITGMFGVVLLIIFGVLKWDDIHQNLEWGTALFIFGGGISLGLAMDYSGAAAYFANLFFPLIRGSGWLLLYLGVGVFGALVTNAMANVAAAALILPIVIPMAQMEGVNPIILALCLGQATSFAMLLVIGCPPNAIAYSYHFFKASDLTKAGAVATPILLAALVLVAAVWWKILGLV